MVLTLLVGSAGWAAAWLVGFPAAPLTGPAAAVTLTSLLGMPVGIPAPLRDACFLTLGMSIGASVTPEVIQTALNWPLSLLVLSAALLATILAARHVLIRWFRFDRVTALLAGTPGHLSYVLGLSTDMAADVPRVTLVQSVRVLLLTFLVPVILLLWGGQGDSVVTDYGQLAPVALIITFALSVAVGFGFRRLRIPAPFLLAGMAVSALGHGTSLTPGAFPVTLSVAAFIVMGSLIGTRFAGVTGAALRDSFIAGVVITLIACAIAALGAVVAARLVGLPPAVLLLAFAPGGVEVMAAMAVQLSLEPAFVAAHHVLRLVVLTFLVPILIRSERRR